MWFILGSRKIAITHRGEFSNEKRATGLGHTGCRGSRVSSGGNRPLHEAAKAKFPKYGVSGNLPAFPGLGKQFTENATLQALRTITSGLPVTRPERGKIAPEEPWNARRVT
jgi:hypothetical protein